MEEIFRKTSLRAFQYQIYGNTRFLIENQEDSLKALKNVLRVFWSPLSRIFFQIFFFPQSPGTVIQTRPRMPASQAPCY